MVWVDYNNLPIYPIFYLFERDNKSELPTVLCVVPTNQGVGTTNLKVTGGLQVRV